MTTILQISDPHLLSRPSGRLKGVPTAETLAAVLAEARGGYPDCARVVWTGDLSHEHTEDGYRLLGELLDDWTERSLFIPGNHDDRVALRRVFPLGGGNNQPVTFQTEVGGWQLIGLDSHVPGEVAGELSEEQLDQLQGWLAADPKRPTLLFVHHPPVSVESRWLDQIALRDPEPLGMLIGGCPGVRAIFCGHVHHAFEGRFVGVPLYTTPSTAFQFQAHTDEVAFDLLPPGFRAIGLRGDRFRTEVLRLRTLGHPPRED